MTLKELFIERLRIISKSLLYSAVIAMILAPSVVIAIAYPIHFTAFVIGFATGNRHIYPHIHAFISKWVKNIKQDLSLHHNHC